MHQKSTVFKGVGMSSYMIALLFLGYTLNHPEGGFVYPISHATPMIYYIYLMIMLSALIVGNISSFKQAIGNRIQTAGCIIFLVGNIFLIIFFTMFILMVSTPIFRAGIYSIILLAICSLLPLPLFVIGMVLNSKEV